MRAQEFIVEDISRRGFLQGAGAAAGMAATGVTQAGEFMQVGDFGLNRFVQEGAKLEARIKPIFQRLLADAGPDAAKFKNIQIQFHLGIENDIERRDKIREGLIKNGFKINFDYPFVWESWCLTK